MVSNWSVAVAITLATFGSLLSGHTLNAQSCIGQMSLRDVRVNGSVDIRMVDQGNGLEGRVGVGNARVFGSAMAGSVLYKKGSKMRSFITGLDGGYSVKLGKSGPNLCPMASVFYENGPDNVAITRAELRGFAGVSVGGAARLSDSASFVSFVAGGLKTTRYSQKLASQPAGEHFTYTDPQVMGGFGIQFKQQFLARVALVLPTAGGDNRGDAPVYVIVGFTVAPRPSR